MRDVVWIETVRGRRIVRIAQEERATRFECETKTCDALGQDIWIPAHGEDTLSFFKAALEALLPKQESK